MMAAKPWTPLQEQRAMAPHHRCISLRPTLPQEPLSAPDVRVSAPPARVADAVDDSEGSPPKRARVDSVPATTTSSSSAPAVIYPPSFLKPTLPLSRCHGFAT